MYRKVVDVGTLPNDNIKNISLNDLSIEKMVKIEGFAFNSENGTLVIPYAAKDLPAQVVVSYSGDANKNLTIATGSDRSGFYCYLTIEYTKTTDTVE